MNKKLLLALPLLAFLVLAGILFSRLGSNPQELPSARLGKPLPSFQLHALLAPNQVLTNADLPKQPFLLNVWASWCPSCAEEHQALMALSKEQQVVIVGVNYKDEPAAAQAFLTKHGGNPYQQIIADVDGNLGLDLGVYGAPETYIVDQQGHIRYRLAGVVAPEVWQQQLWPCYQAVLQQRESAACQF